MELLDFFVVMWQRNNLPNNFNLLFMNVQRLNFSISLCGPVVSSSSKLLNMDVDESILDQDTSCLSSSSSTGFGKVLKIISVCHVSFYCEGFEDETHV